MVDLPQRKLVIGSKWIYKIKTHMDGSIEWYKGHLLIRGFAQEYGID